MCADIPEVYTITCGTNVTASKTQAMAGEMITVTADSVANKRFSAITLDGESISTTTTATFEMPIKNVSIEAVYNQLYTISCNTVTGGSITYNGLAAEGDTVTITISSNEGYQLSSISISNVTLNGTGNTRTFTMPGHNVTIEASFTDITFSASTPVELWVDSNQIYSQITGDPISCISEIISGDSITYLSLKGTIFHVVSSGWILGDTGSSYKPKNANGLVYTNGRLVINLESISNN